MKKVSEETQVEIQRVPVIVPPKHRTEITLADSSDTLEAHSLPGVPGAFTVPGVLSETECDVIVERCTRLRFRSLEKEFAPEERNNKRCTLLDRTLAACLWRRLRACFTDERVCFMVPTGFGNDGIWKPKRLNECLKVSVYEGDGDQHFREHMDGPWVPRPDECSIFTVVLYLSEPSDTLKDSGAAGGGQTEFFSEPTEDSPQSALTASVQPVKGTALCFLHDTLHAGAPPRRWSKYVLRTEVMFCRTHAFEQPDHTELPAYQQLVKVYAMSHEAFKNGDVASFTRYYKQAIGLQRAEVRPFARQQTALSSLPVPREVLLLILSYCDLQTVLAFDIPATADELIAADWTPHFFRELKEYRTALGQASRSPGSCYERYRKWTRMARARFPTLLFQFGSETCMGISAHLDSVTELKCLYQVDDMPYHHRRSRSGFIVGPAADVKKCERLVLDATAPVGAVHEFCICLMRRALEAGVLCFIEPHGPLDPNLKISFRNDFRSVLYVIAFIPIQTLLVDYYGVSEPCIIVSVDGPQSYVALSTDLATAQYFSAADPPTNPFAQFWRNSFASSSSVLSPEFLARKCTRYLSSDSGVIFAGATTRQFERRFLKALRTREPNVSKVNPREELESTRRHIPILHARKLAEDPHWPPREAIFH